jgi:hypothetical protein
MKPAISAVLLLLAVGVYIGGDILLDLPPSELVFVSEIVRARPEGDRIAFQCEFVYRANHPRRKNYELAFVTSETSETPPPENVNVTAGGQSIPVQVRSQGFTFRLPVKGKGQETTVKIEYSLSAPQHKAVYVTRTANLWPTPIENARFELPPDAQSNYHKKGEMIAEFTQFHPKENWHIEWR